MRVGRKRGKRRFGHRIGTRRDNPRRARMIELDKQIRSAKTVERVKSLEIIVDIERGFIGEQAHRDLRSLAAERLDKVGRKVKKISLGPLGEVGGESEGKVL